MSRMSRSRRLAGLSLICLIALCAAARQSPAQTGRGSGIRQSAREAEAPEKRLALVVGNGAYQNAGPLNNPANDAADMAATLRALGFEVFYGVNQSLPQMRKLVREFGAKLRQGRGVGLFYYAGHGVQVGGRNFLIPVEADIGSEVETEDVALDVNSVLRHMDAAGNNLNIVILDACRNNPFARSWNRDLSSGGLAQISAPSGMLIAYATCPGCVASDGAGRNGLYTAALLTQMKRPNVDLLRMFQNVRADVKQKSLGRRWLMRVAASRTSGKPITTGRLPTSRGRLTFPRPTRRRTTTAATPTLTRRITTARWRISTKQSRSTRRMRSRTALAPSCMRRKATRRGRGPTGRSIWS